MLFLLQDELAEVKNLSGVRFGGEEQADLEWCFAPHTAHNSLVLDIGLASEVCTLTYCLFDDNHRCGSIWVCVCSFQIERAMAGKDETAKACALLKLRERVRQVSRKTLLLY